MQASEPGICGSRVANARKWREQEQGLRLRRGLHCEMHAGMIGIAALMFLAQLTGGDARDAPADLLIFATIGHSEWCPAGNVQIHLRTGDYTLTPRAARSVCSDPELVRPILRGRLEATRLAAIREAWEEAWKSGLNNCRRGESGGVFSNASTPIMVLTSGARTLAAPQEYGCWSLAGSALYRAIEDGFEAAHQR